MTGGDYDPQGEKGLPLHWSRGGDVEGIGGDFKLPAHILHHLPRIPPRILGGKMLQKLAALREDVLYMIFLDLHRVYDALERYRCLKILDGYGVGP